MTLEKINNTQEELNGRALNLLNTNRDLVDKIAGVQTPTDSKIEGENKLPQGIVEEIYAKQETMQKILDGLFANHERLYDKTVTSPNLIND